MHQLKNLMLAFYKPRKMKDLLHRLYFGHYLSRAEASQVVEDITNKKYSDVQNAALLSALNMRLPSTEEMLGYRDTMLKQALNINIHHQKVIDIVGTGGDGKDTFNISTLACLVCAGAGIKVAKHGNYSASSVSGSSNILEAVGVVFSNDETILNQQLNDANITFLHAPLFHPAMKNIGALRKEMGVKTIFNLLGPLSNPCEPTIQMIGVYSDVIGNLYKNVLLQLKSNFAVVHAIDGYDEISLTAETRVSTKDKDIYFLPKDFGAKTIQPHEIYGGNTIESNKTIFLNVLNGKGTEAQNNVVIANAALGISLYTNKNLEESLVLAKESLLGLKALACLEKLK